MSVATALHDPAGLPEGFAETVGLDAERARDIDAFARRVIEANQRMNLIGPATVGDFARRHVLDSAQLVWFAPQVRRWADIGSGAGLPGVILAILMKGRPGAHVDLIESVAKRADFLAGTVEALNLPATVHHQRAEKLRLEVEVVTARACAPLHRLLDLIWPFMARGAHAMLLKGKATDLEVAEARKRWRFECQTRQSLSDPSGRVLVLEGLAHAAKA